MRATAPVTRWDAPRRMPAGLRSFTLEILVAVCLIATLAGNLAG